MINRPNLTIYKAQIKSAWILGNIFKIPDTDNKHIWTLSAHDLANELDVKCEVATDGNNNTFVRGNYGFPLDFIAFSPEAKQWLEMSKLHQLERNSWNNIFERGIC